VVFLPQSGPAGSHYTPAHWAGTWDNLAQAFTPASQCDEKLPYPLHRFQLALIIHLYAVGNSMSGVHMYPMTLSTWWSANFSLIQVLSAFVIHLHSGQGIRGDVHVNSTLTTHSAHLMISCLPPFLRSWGFH
jgi:hypothetical protein